MDVSRGTAEAVSPLAKLLAAMWRTPLDVLVGRYRKGRQVVVWKWRGRPVPPPSTVKQAIVRKYARNFGLVTFVETGTFAGEMVDATLHVFKTIYSIELSEELHAKAKERFRASGHVTLLQGDSGSVLPSLMEDITEPCLFWLDGHYSGGVTAKGDVETPIAAELEAILGHACRRHVILIDDARCFTGGGDYPTLSELQRIVASHGGDYSFAVGDDIIRIVPRHVTERESWISGQVGGGGAGLRRTSPL